MDDEEELDFFKMAPTTTERDNEGASSTLKELEYEYARGLITHGPILEHINDRSFMDIRTSEDSKEVISIFLLRRTYLENPKKRLKVFCKREDQRRS